MAGASPRGVDHLSFFRLRGQNLFYPSLYPLNSPAIIHWTARRLAAIFSRGVVFLSLPPSRPAAMLQLDSQQGQLLGPSGALPLSAHDEVSRKLAMLISGECLGLGPTEAARLFGYTKQRYFQLRDGYAQKGAAALVNHRPGPARTYRCTDEVVRQVVRHRFLDPEASPEVIAQRLTQGGLPVSARSVERVIERFGLQKKTAPLPAGPPARRAGGRQPGPRRHGPE
jgi:hypothetical protein